MSKQPQKIGVFIGRFQPLHIAHVLTIKRMIEQMDKVVIIVGRHRGAPSPRDPWSFSDRQRWIRTCVGFLQDDVEIHIEEARCTIYDDAAWVQTIKNKVNAHRSHEDDQVFLYGHHKDATSAYLSWFPDWAATDISDSLPMISSTQIREKMFENGVRRGVLPEDREWEYLPECVRNDMRTPPGEIRLVLDWLQEDWKHIVAYKRSWATAPYPPVLVTADSVIFHAGQVLLVRRGGPYRKGTLALPGGHFDTEKDMNLLATAVRETLEETGVKLHPEVEAGNSAVFAHPLRSHLGRVVTQAFHFTIQGERKIVAGDDAASVEWVALTELHRLERFFFEDHFDIIETFLHRKTHAARHFT